MREIMVSLTIWKSSIVDFLADWFCIPQKTIFGCWGVKIFQILPRSMVQNYSNNIVCFVTDIEMFLYMTLLKIFYFTISSIKNCEQVLWLF
jgi:hypothetical protein